MATRISPVPADPLAEGGRRQKVVITGRNGLPVKVLGAATDGQGALLTFSDESRRLLEELIVALQENTEALNGKE